MRERILSSVLFPAPLRPMMPRASPSRTSNETSRKAQIVLSSSSWLCWRLAMALTLCSDLVAQGLMARLEPPDPVHLRKVMDPNGDVAHQITSANVVSMRLK